MTLFVRLVLATRAYDCIYCCDSHLPNLPDFLFSQIYAIHFLYLLLYNFKCICFFSVSNLPKLLIKYNRVNDTDTFFIGATFFCKTNITIIYLTDFFLLIYAKLCLKIKLVCCVYFSTVEIL